MARILVSHINYTIDEMVSFQKTCCSKDGRDSVAERSDCGDAGLQILDSNLYTNMSCKIGWHVLNYILPDP